MQNIKNFSRVGARKKIYSIEYIKTSTLKLKINMYRYCTSLGLHAMFLTLFNKDYIFYNLQLFLIFLK